MSGSFDTAADNYLTMSVGNAGAIGTGAYTIACLVQPAIGNNNCGMVEGHASGGAAVRSLLEDTLHLYGEGDFSSGDAATLIQGTWYVAAQTKAAGSATYRHHLWAYISTGTGTMTHAVSSSSANHGDGSAVTDIHIGHAGNRGNGLIAVVGLWTSELSDANLDTLKSGSLQAWADLNPAELFSLENWDGSTGIDTVIGTSTLTSETGSVTAGANPTGFDFAVGGATDLVVADVTQAQTIDNVTLTQVHSLTVQDIMQAQTIDNVTLTQVHSLAVQDALQAQSIDNINLTQVHSLIVQDVLQAQTIDNVVLAVNAVDLVVADVLQAQSVGNTVLTQLHNLIVQDMRQLQLIDNVVLVVPSEANGEITVPPVLTGGMMYQTVSLAGIIE